MAIQLTIAGVDRTRQVAANSIKINNILTNKRDMAEFFISTHSGDSYVPAMGGEVVIYDGATKIFGGIITQIQSKPQAFHLVNHQITCQDYTRLLDHKLVPDAFTNKTVDEIIATLAANYFPAGFTITNVDAPVMVSYVSFNYRPLAVCLQDLANMINYDWYVDYDKDVHFFAKETVPAPFGLTDTGGKYRYNTLLIRKDNSQIRNSVIVRGGEYIGSQLTVDIQTNGVDFFFPLPYRFSDFEATLSGSSLNIGIDNIDQPDSFDALYNFQEKILKFKEADKPANMQTIKAAGKPYLPVIVRYRSPASIAAMTSAEGGDGQYEYLIEDKSINSKEGARQRARAEILAYAQTLSEGEFVTETSGLRAGMAISVQSDSRNIDETFIINKVVTTQFSKDAFLYEVSLITTRTMDLIDVLQKLLLEGTKKLSIDPNETTDIVFDFDSAGNFVDSLGTFSTHSETYTWGPSSEEGKWNFATWS